MIHDVKMVFPELSIQSHIQDIQRFQTSHRMLWLAFDMNDSLDNNPFLQLLEVLNVFSPFSVHEAPLLQFPIVQVEFWEEHEDTNGFLEVGVQHKSSPHRICIQKAAILLSRKNHIEARPALTFSHSYYLFCEY